MSVVEIERGGNRNIDEKRKHRSHESRALWVKLGELDAPSTSLKVGIPSVMMCVGNSEVMRVRREKLTNQMIRFGRWIIPDYVIFRELDSKYLSKNSQGIYCQVFLFVSFSFSSSLNRFGSC